jgi:2-polyprenyl-3-methyl-5-hydroxy-6-metoxy-1,4-benzoquinol methylase
LAAVTARPPRIGILVVAYNAASTLHQVLDRIPVDFRSRIERVLVSDDASVDATYLVGLGWQQVNAELPLTVIRHEQNLGYGGNQKAGYRWAIEHDLDIVVLLHGDGQYAPELLPEMVAPLERGEADAVFGSRMVEPGRARAGGMPRYKYLGNRILTGFENAVMGSALSEWHSGYRAYSVAALADLPLEVNSDGFDFDTQVIIQLMEAGKRIAEIPIPTYYGDEISHVNGIRYAWDICGAVVAYRLQKMGFGAGDLAFASTDYETKPDADSSHGLVVDRLARRAAGRLLDLGCGDGTLGAQLRERGWEVTGVDHHPSDIATARLDRFVVADLDEGLPPAVTDAPCNSATPGAATAGSDAGHAVAGPNGSGSATAGYDAVLAADVLEHVRHPETLLEEIRQVMAPGGVLLASVPNVAHWYVRGRVVAGRWDYERRGILDRTHLRFFTRRSFAALARRHGWRVQDVAATGLPLDIVDRGAQGQLTGMRRVVRDADRAAVAVWPTLFGYQFLFELVPDR